MPQPPRSRCHSAAFDVSGVDTTSVRFGVTGMEGAPVQSHVEDVNGDGVSDLVFHFRTRSLGLDPGGGSPVILKLTGQTRDGQPFEGEDVARLVP